VVEEGCLLWRPYGDGYGRSGRRRRHGWPTLLEDKYRSSKDLQAEDLQQIVNRSSREISLDDDEEEEED
jgi:hypothetical protein